MFLSTLFKRKDRGIMVHPSDKDISVFVFFAMNKPSNLDFPSACKLAGEQFKIGEHHIKQAIIRGANS